MWVPGVLGVGGALSPHKGGAGEEGSGKSYGKRQHWIMQFRSVLGRQEREESKRHEIAGRKGQRNIAKPYSSLKGSTFRPFWWATVRNAYFDPARTWKQNFQITILILTMGAFSFLSYLKYIYNPRSEGLALRTISTITFLAKLPKPGAIWTPELLLFGVLLSRACHGPTSPVSP